MSLSSFQSNDTEQSSQVDAHMSQLVTVYVEGQLFGLPILQVRDVFIVSDVTPVPLAAQSVAGLFNLRGRVMTMLSMRALLGHKRDSSKPESTAIGIEWRGESYGLLVDRVGEVMNLSASSREANPINLDPRWAALSAGVHRLQDQLLVEVSLDTLFNSQLQKAT
ncbi:MAG: chemotaxis protein CheW [Beijerinckiaceae bacterium]